MSSLMVDIIIPGLLAFAAPIIVMIVGELVKGTINPLHAFFCFLVLMTIVILALAKMFMIVVVFFSLAVIGAALLY